MFFGGKESSFELLGHFKKIVSEFKGRKIKKVIFDLFQFEDEFSLNLLNSFVSALEAGLFGGPQYTKKGNSPKHEKVTLLVLGKKESLTSLKKTAKSAQNVTEGTNLARTLASRAFSDLTCLQYVKEIKSMAKDLGLKLKIYGKKELEKMGAGAFLAVARGCAHGDSCIVRLDYAPKGVPAPHVTFVGKGIMYDTGGVSLKPARYMFGMEADMMGSAVALALIQTAVREKWDIGVRTYLAVTDNAIGSKSYTPNEVVTSLSGKTIEVVHTDAEGRMALADTLFLASKEKTDLIIDFATLTGSCVGAIGTTYSGVFTNRETLHTFLIQSGKSSGEKVWPFPVDKEFRDVLKSDIADIKQCLLTGGVDHIEAASFLKEFLQRDVPWVHIDLSAGEHSGGLAHIPEKYSGFGVRFVNELINPQGDEKNIFSRL